MKKSLVLFLAVLCLAWAQTTGTIDEWDCNGNLQPDSFDIANGDSLDCDLDGVPDECQDDVVCLEAAVEEVVLFPPNDPEIPSWTISLIVIGGIVFLGCSMAALARAMRRRR